jgi:2-isopropylmalate synthase
MEIFMSTKEKNKVLIFDTTLRDGEQSPGATMSLAQKIEIASLLDEMGVDIIEAGFPIASEGDFEAVSKIGKTVKSARVCGLARASKLDIERCWRAVENSINPRIHTFIGTSPLHREFQVKLSKEEVLDKVFETVTFAKSFCDDVQWSPMDATRTESEFLVEVVKIAIQAGASTINIPDTVGYTAPKESANIIKNLFLKIPELKNIIVSTHCHNDLGMATANSLAAVEAGARQVECTINGLGERAGNAALEEIVMAVRTRKDFYNCETRIDSKFIVPTSKLVSSITGFPVQPNKAIVGANAFAHESGIHQDGVLKSRETYEIMKAEDVGWQANKLVLGKHSGRNALKQRLNELGFLQDDEENFNLIFQKFKDLADKKHEIFDEDLISLLSDETGDFKERFSLISLEINSKTGESPCASITINDSGKEIFSKQNGSGPIDAVFKAIEHIVKSGADLQLYSVNAITKGTDSLGEVGVRLSKNGRVVNGHGSDIDIIAASAKSYLNALNNLLNSQEKINPQSV